MTSPSMTRIIDGGMIWPSVPDAQIVPADTSGEYPRRNIVGSESRPMVTTVAPTIPVLAANSIPTRVTDMPKPPRRLPNSPLRVSSRSSAIRARSSVTPINTNKGTATSVWLFMMPNTRFGNPDSSAALNSPASTPTPAKINAVPPSVNATGKPASNTRITDTNSSSATHSMITDALLL